MGTERIAAVADAGPLIHLYEIGSLGLLGYFTELHVPDTVWEEATRGGRVPVTALHALPRLVRHSLEEPDCLQAEDFGHLHGGEKECLCLCAQLKISLILTDDLAAREIAPARGVTPVGSVGIIVKNCATGRISLAQAETALLDLYETSTLFVAKSIVNGAIEALRRHMLDQTR